MTMVRSVVGHHKSNEIDPPRCKKTTTDFMFYDVEGNQLEGSAHLTPKEDEVLKTSQIKTSF